MTTFATVRSTGKEVQIIDSAYGRHKCDDGKEYVVGELKITQLKFKDGTRLKVSV